MKGIDIDIIEYPHLKRLKYVNVGKATINHPNVDGYKLYIVMPSIYDKNWRWIIFQGLVTVPFWVYWTSPYSSHYRPYT